MSFIPPDPDPRENYVSRRQEALEFDAWLKAEQTRAIERIAAAVEAIDELANKDIAAPDCDGLTIHDVDYAQGVAEEMEALFARLRETLERRRMGRPA